MTVEHRIIYLSEVMRVVEQVLSANFVHKFKKGECMYTPSVQVHKFTFSILEDVELKIYFEHDIKSDRFMFEVYSGGVLSSMSRDEYSKRNGSVVLIEIGIFFTDVIKQKFISNT